MRYVCLMAVSVAVLCLVGCASPAKLTVSEPVGPAPTERAGTPDGSGLQASSGKVRAPVDVNMEEFLWNNDFGRNEFLH